jgi:hypothetical protein
MGAKRWADAPVFCFVYGRLEAWGLESKIMVTKRFCVIMKGTWAGVFVPPMAAAARAPKKETPRFGFLTQGV